MSESNQQTKYVLVTPARDEGEFIELTIKSVVAQTLRPLKWVIVSDGSTDRTAEIAEQYARQHSWIEVVRIPARKGRNFAGKVTAFNAGYARLKDLDYDFIGCMDGDISFDAEYFEFLLERFVENNSLGVAGTPFSEHGKTYDYRYVSRQHVSGACQLYRRKCFEQIGGYKPLKHGAVDMVAVVTARMRGWQTRCFVEKVCQHHRASQLGRHRSCRRMFKTGFNNYLLGSHPAWQTARSIYQMGRRPFIVGGLLILAGYLWGAISSAPRPVSDDFVKFWRREQMGRLRERLPLQSVDLTADRARIIRNEPEVPAHAQLAKH